MDMLVRTSRLLLQPEHIGYDLIHLPRPQTAPGRDNQRPLIQAQRLPGILLFGIQKFLPHRHPHNLHPLGVTVLRSALGKGDQNLIHPVGHHPCGETRYGVALMDAGGHSQLRPLF